MAPFPSTALIFPQFGEKGDRAIYFYRTRVIKIAKDPTAQNATLRMKEYWTDPEREIFAKRNISRRDHTDPEST